MHTAPHHRTRDLCTNPSRGTGQCCSALTGQGTDPAPRENVFARFRSESTQENSDGSMDTPLAFKMRLGGLGWCVFCYNYLQVQQSQTLKEAA